MRAFFLLPAERSTPCFYATELMGAKTYDAQGNYVGQDSRVFYRTGGPSRNRIAHYFAVAREFFSHWWRVMIRSASVGALGNVRLNVNEQLLEPYEPNEAWLAVQKRSPGSANHRYRPGRKVVRVERCGPCRAGAPNGSNSSCG